VGIIQSWASIFIPKHFVQLKQEYPTIKLHALGPPEIAHITKLEKSTHHEVLKALKEAGLDSVCLVLVPKF
jgi:cyclic dehypoxanthinyl futalosine synthase